MKYYWEVVKINAKTGESNARLKSGPRNKVLRGHKDLVTEQKQQQILINMDEYTVGRVCFSQRPPVSPFHSLNSFQKALFPLFLFHGDSVLRWTQTWVQILALLLTRKSLQSASWNHHLLNENNDNFLTGQVSMVQTTCILQSHNGHIIVGTQQVIISFFC